MPINRRPTGTPAGRSSTRNPKNAREVGRREGAQMRGGELAAPEAYSLYVEGCRKLANEADAPLSASAYLSSQTRCMSIRPAGIIWKPLTYLWKIFCSLRCRRMTTGASSMMIFTASS